MNIKIIKTSLKDVEEVAKIYAKEFSKEPYNEKWNQNKATNKIKNLLRYCDVYTIFANNLIVGFFAINPNFMLPGDVIFGEEFAIKDSYQNKGIGSYCIKWVEKKYSKKGYKELLFIALRKSKAFKIYKKLGYIESKRDALMEKDLK